MKEDISKTVESNNSSYLIQSNFFTRSLFKTEKDIHKDFIYLLQKKINYFGTPQDIITISFDDYLNAKGVSKNDTYSFKEFKRMFDEITKLGGAFFNRINNSFVSYNLIDNVQLDLDNPNSLNVQLANFGKVFFYKESLETYIKEISPITSLAKYNGYTKIESSVISMKGFRRKKFFEIISQFKSAGWCKISVMELKMYLGLLEVVDKETRKPINQDQQLKFLFLPEDDVELIDNAPSYSYFERDILKPAIKEINQDVTKDIYNLKIKEKLKNGRKITHLVFTFSPAKRKFTEEEQTAIENFTKLGLDVEQVERLILRIGYKEMYGRWMLNVKKTLVNDVPVYYNRNNNQVINNLSGFLYKNVFYKELQ